MDKAITTALLIIAGVVCMIFVFNSVYPMINRSSAAMVSMAETVDERMKSRINIVHAANSANRTTLNPAAFINFASSDQRSSGQCSG